MTNIEKVIKDTLFLTKTLDFFDGFKAPGIDYNIIACQSSSDVAERYPNILVGEIIYGKRIYATSKVLLQVLNDYDKIKEYSYKYLWTYQAYSWTNDFRYSGKSVFAIDYFLFLKLQNKLIQKKLLLEQASQSRDCFLKENLATSLQVFKTQISPKNNHSYESLSNILGTSFVIADSNSNGGEGIYLIKNIEEYKQAMSLISSPIIRAERYLTDGIPMNQIGFITSNGLVVKYKPSIQIIQDIHGEKRMEYGGCEFQSDDYLKNSQLTHTNISRLTHNIGLLLYKLGYRGTFGCDYLVVGDNIYFIEINPRYQASTLIPNMHLCANPILAPHILHILGFVKSAELDIIKNRRYNTPECYIDFLQPQIPTGYLNIHKNKPYEYRKPSSGVVVEEGVSKGYLLFNSPIINSPVYPAKLKV